MVLAADIASQISAKPREAAAGRYEVIVIGAGISGMYQLYRLRELGHDGARLRGRRRRRRHLVLEPLSRRALRLRELDLRLLLLRRAAAGMGLERAFLAPARDAALLQLRRRQVRPAPRHHVRQPRRVGALRRDGQRVGDRHSRTAGSARSRFLVTAIGPLSAPTMPAIPGVDDFQGEAYHTGTVAARAGELRRQARGRDRHRRHRRAGDHRDRQDSRAT